MLAVALSMGSKLTPFIDLAYVSEDTTSASYSTELATDGTAADLGASAADGYIAYGGGFILNLSNSLFHLSFC